MLYLKVWDATTAGLKLPVPCK